MPRSSTCTSLFGIGVSPSFVPTYVSPVASSASSSTRFPSASRAGVIRYVLPFAGGARVLPLIPSIASGFERMWPVE